MSTATNPPPSGLTNPPVPQATAAAPAELLDQLAASRVVIASPDDLRAYLAVNPDLAELLPEVCARTRAEFGEQAELTLDVIGDPELPDIELRLFVRQWPYDDDTMPKVERVSAAFEEQLSRCSGWLLVTTDFRRPRSSHGGV